MPSLRDGGARADGVAHHGGLRADAVRNRVRIRAAAGDLLAEHGPNVSLDRIARQAGVSNATLYRHYANRRELLSDVAEQIALAAAEAAEEAEAELTAGDPLTALRGFATVLAARRSAALYCLPEGSTDDTGADDGPRERVVAATRRLLERAQRAGRVREEVTAEDVLAVVAQLGRPLPGADWRAADALGPRLLRQYMDGLVVPPPRTAREQERVPGR